MCLPKKEPVAAQATYVHLPNFLADFISGDKRIGTAVLAIRSAHFGTYLRMDARGTYSSTGTTEGFGIVNAQTYIGLWELFRFVPQQGGTVAIQSLHFKTWLRVDSRSLVEQNGGIVNCQSFVGSMERFYIEPQDDGTVSLRSAEFGTYLRMDGIGINTNPHTLGGGIVNCSNYLGSWERFHIDVVPPVVAIKSINSRSFLRMDGRDVSEPLEAGGGFVGCREYIGDWGKFQIEAQEDGTVAFKSVPFGAYLRVDGEHGKVNCQSFVGHFERFYCVPQDDGHVVIMSVACGKYLSVSVTGEVSVGENVGVAEKFQIYANT